MANGMVCLAVGMIAAVITGRIIIAVVKSKRAKRIRENNNLK